MGSSKDKVKPPLSETLVCPPPQPRSPAEGSGAEGQGKSLFATGSTVLWLQTGALMMPGHATLCKVLIWLSPPHCSQLMSFSEVHI